MKKGGFAQKSSQLSSSSLPAWLLPLFHHLLWLLCIEALCPAPHRVCLEGGSHHTYHIFPCSAKGEPMASSLEVLVEAQRLSAMPEPCKLNSCIDDCKLRFGSANLGCSEALWEGGRYELRRDRRTGTNNCILVCYRHMDGKMCP